MTDECNRKRIMAYIFVNCPVCDDTIHSDIINEAMELLNARGYLYVNQLDMIIDKYCPPPKNIFDSWYYEDTPTYEEFELLQ